MKHIRYHDKQGSVISVYPPMDYLTNGPWIYMVPQFKPESVLMLGYGGGTVAGLIRLLYGDIPITGVDIKPCENLYGVSLIQANAKDYIKSCPHFDVCIVDLFSNDSNPSDFIFSEEFVSALSKICNYIIINITSEMDMSIYKNRFHRYGSNTPNRLSNRIYYFGTKEIVPDPILR